jgi:catechol 2,3-dioxygenase-like lactoylglutathione lyase family enzyme
MKPSSLEYRRQRVWPQALALLALLLTAASLSLGNDARPAEQVGVVQSVARVGLTVSDLDRLVDFYATVLDFQKVSETEVAGREFERQTGVFGARARIARLRLGEEEIELTEFLTPRGREVPRDSRSNDGWFQHVAIITSDMDAAYRRLRRHKVRHASSGPQRLPDWNKNAGGIRAFYFHDPDGHVLEVLQFPPGKGHERWQRTDRLFLGIDHTAIVVADTDRSLAFYRDRLGMKVVGGSENWGDEQEHLNNVFGARLRITTLRADGGGPGVELLEYLAPRDGRPYPLDARPSDLFHWHTTVRAAPDAGPASAASLVRDPDGHAVQLVQE